MEIFISDGGILLKRYYAESSLNEIMKALKEAVEDMCEDLGPERTGNIRQYIQEIQSVLNEGVSP